MCIQITHIIRMILGAVLFCSILSPLTHSQAASFIDERIGNAITHQTTWVIEVYRRDGDNEEVLCKERIDRPDARKDGSYLYSGKQFSVLERMRDKTVTLRIKDLKVEGRDLSGTHCFQMGKISCTEQLLEDNLYIRVKNTLDTPALRIGWKATAYESTSDGKTKVICREYLDDIPQELENGSLVYRTRHFTIIKPASGDEPITLKVKNLNHGGKLLSDEISFKDDKDRHTLKTKREGVFVRVEALREGKNKTILH